MRPPVHVHIDRVVVERGFDPDAFARALREVLSRSSGLGPVSPVARLSIEVAAAPRRLSGALGSAVGRALAGVSGPPGAPPPERSR